MYNAFRGAEERITTRVLLNHLNPELLHDAICAQETSSPRETVDILKQYLDHQRPLPVLKWRLSEALSMGKLYDHVHYFATDLASKALAKNPVSGESDIAPTPPSQSELTRIERTLYRFEIYCNVFRGPPNTFLSLRRRWFFFQFSPWENEQMACIYDHFVSVVTPGIGIIEIHYMCFLD